MTDPDHRGKDLQKCIFNEIMADFAGRYEGMFLFANKSVLDFYPKLDFERAEYHSFSKAVAHKPAQLVKLDMSSSQAVKLLKKYYAKGNPFSALQVVDGFALLMFYCGSFFKDFVYWLPEQDAVVVAETDGHSLTCYGIYCDADKDINGIINSFPAKTVTFAFTPKDTTGCEIKTVMDDDSALFVHSSGENIFTAPLLFPEIFHT